MVWLITDLYHLYRFWYKWYSKYITCTICYTTSKAGIHQGFSDAGTGGTAISRACVM
ncbi:hypothetical protein ACYTIM_000551 [Morganella morganii]